MRRNSTPVTDEPAARRPTLQKRYLALRTRPPSHLIGDDDIRFIAQRPLPRPETLDLPLRTGAWASWPPTWPGAASPPALLSTKPLPGNLDPSPESQSARHPPRSLRTDSSCGSKLVALRASGPPTFFFSGAFPGWLHVAGRGLMGNLAAETMAGCRLMWPDIRRRWLPGWLPNLVSAANVREPGQADESRRYPRSGNSWHTWRTGTPARSAAARR